MAPMEEAGLFVVALGGLLTTLAWAVVDRLATRRRRFIAWTPGWWIAAIALAAVTKLCPRPSPLQPDLDLLG